MKPTPEQITHIINAIARYPADIDSSYPARVIDHWESIRPKDLERESWAELYNIRGKEMEGLRAELAALKAAVPAPKPTPEEMEQDEINAAYVFSGTESLSLESFRAGWKAAKKGLTTP